MPEAWVLDDLRRRVEKLEANTEDINVLRAELVHIKREMHELGTEVNSLRKALYTTALSVTSGAVVLAFTVLQVVH